MFTVKLYRGNSSDAQDPRVPIAMQILEARTVEVQLGVELGSKHIIINPGQQDEHHEYVKGESARTGAPDDWNWAVIENAAGKTTEVIRP